MNPDSAFFKLGQSKEAKAPSLKQKREEFACEIRQKAREQDFAKARHKESDAPVHNILADVAGEHMRTDENLQRLKNFIDECTHKQFSPEDLPALAADLQSEDIYKQHFGVIGLRSLLTKKKGNKIIIQQIIDRELVPVLISKLSDHAQPQLQAEAGWVLVNLAAGSQEQTEAIAHRGGLQAFLTLLQNPNPAIAEHGLWGIGNFAADSIPLRDEILEAGSVDFIGQLLERNPDHYRTWKIGTWALSNCCRGRPAADFVKIVKCLPYFTIGLGKIKESEGLSDITWALTYISGENTDRCVLNAALDGDNLRAKIMMESGILPMLVPHLVRDEISLVLPTLRVFGNVMSGDSSFTEEILNLGILNEYLRWLNCATASVRREVCWALTTVTSASHTTISTFLGHQEMVDKLISMIQEDTPEIKKEIWWVFHNIFVHGNDDQVRSLMQGPVFEILCEALRSDDSESIYLGLESIERLFKLSWDGTKVEPQLLELLESKNILKTLEGLQEWPEPEVYEFVSRMIEKYLPVEQTDLL